MRNQNRLILIENLSFFETFIDKVRTDSMNCPVEFISAYFKDLVHRFTIMLTHVWLRYEVNNVIYMEIIPNSLRIQPNL